MEPSVNLNAVILLAGRLAALVSSILGNRVPVTMTALEAVTRLLGVLEEVDVDLRILLYEPLMMKLTSACSAVRHQVNRLHQAMLTIKSWKSCGACSCLCTVFLYK